MKNQRDLRRLPTVFLTVLTLLLAIALCWAAADIWLRGSLRRSADPAAVIYSVEAVRTWAIRILPVFLLWLLALGASCRAVSVPRPSEQVSCRRGERVPALPAVGRLRSALFALAVLLIVLGVLNGSLGDVLTKAVNLCTECIGLG